MKNYHKNPRTITDKQFSDLQQWLTELGDLSGIVHDLNSDEIVAGNQRGRVFDINQCEIVLVEEYAEPDQQGTVAVGHVTWEGHRYGYRAVRWSAKQCEKANVVANRAGGEWDFDVLANEFELGELLEWGFTEYDFQLAGVDWGKEEPAADPGPQVDRAEELQEKWQVQRGQVWEIGRHRLMCGDSTDAGDVGRLMGGEKVGLVFADPPFGISYTGHGKSKDGRANKFEPIAGDEKPNADWLSLCVLDHGAIYVKTHWNVLEFWKISVANVAKVKSIIVWDRCSHSAGDVMGGYATQSELLIFGTFGNHKISRFDTDVWRIERATTGAPEQRTGHPYESPVALPKRAVENSSRINEVCFDPFVGSGTTLVACEQTGRIGYGMEIEPKYCAVTLERLTGMGLEARVVG